MTKKDVIPDWSRHSETRPAVAKVMMHVLSALACNAGAGWVSRVYPVMHGLVVEKSAPDSAHDSCSDETVPRQDQNCKRNDHGNQNRQFRLNEDKGFVGWISMVAGMHSVGFHVKYKSMKGVLEKCPDKQAHGKQPKQIQQIRIRSMPQRESYRGYRKDRENPEGAKSKPPLVDVHDFILAKRIVKWFESSKPARRMVKSVECLYRIPIQSMPGGYMKHWMFVAVVFLGSIPGLGQNTKSSNATLVVTNTGSGPLYIEGAIPFFRVESNGKTVDQKRLENKTATFSLAPGDYELVGYDRPCDGNCGFLDP